MDDDAALRSLGAELEREDPHLAALLSGVGPRRRTRRRVWFLLALPSVIGLLLLPPTTAVGVVVLLLVIAAPVAGYLAGARTYEGPPSGG
jgi:hypothetical protein